jgi:hypothetical protein
LVDGRLVSVEHPVTGSVLKRVWGQVMNPSDGWGGKWLGLSV